MKNKKFIGITGLAGSGKSSASDIIREKGHPVIDLDRVGHSILNDKSVISTISKTFGDNIISKQGFIDRTILGSIVFGSLEKLEILNAIMWPLMREKIIEIRNRLFKKLDMVFLDGAVIFQAGFDDLCDKVIWIDCEDNLRLERLSLRIGKERAEKLIISQKDMYLFKEKANFIIENNHDIYQLKNNIEKIISIIQH